MADYSRVSRAMGNERKGWKKADLLNTTSADYQILHLDQCIVNTAESLHDGVLLWLHDAGASILLAWYE